MLQLYSDAQFAAPHAKQLNYLVNTSFSPPVYAYVFDHPGIGIYITNGTGKGNNHILN